MAEGNVRRGMAARRHGYRFWLLRCRRWLTGVDPLIFDRLGYLGLLAFACVAFFVGLGDHGILNGNESLYVEAAREMALSGEWAVPTQNGLPYLEKPPLFVWLVRAAMGLDDSIELSPRLVTATAALALVLGVMRYSVLLKVGRRGFAAAFILTTSLGMDIMARVAMPDMALTTCFALACLAFLAAVRENSLRQLRLAAGLLGAASLIKGGLALLLFTLIALAYYRLAPDRRRDILRLARDPIAALLLILPFCLWLAAAEYHLPGAASHVVIDEHILRFLGMREPHDYYSGSPLYYVPRLFLFFFPWAGVLLFGWLGRSRAVAPEKREVRQYLWLCVWVPFAFFSVSSAKANYYIVLCLPAMALLAADYLPDLLRERRRLHLAMAIIMPIMLFIALLAFRVWQIRSGMAEAVAPVRDGSGALTIAVLLILALLAMAIILAGWRRPAILCLGGLILPVSFQLDRLVAHAEPYLSARTMAGYIQENYGAARVFLFEDFEAFGALPIYLRRTIPVIDSKSNDLFFGRRLQPAHPNLVTADAVLAAERDALIVVMTDRQQDFAETPLAADSAELTRIGKAVLYRFRRQ